MSDTVDHRAEPAPDEYLVDVTPMSLTELVSTDNVVLADAARRVLDQLHSSRDVIAGWSSYQP